MRFLLILVGLYYLIKLVIRWLVRPGAGRVRSAGTRPERHAGGTDRRYRDLTDQRIEDADYEEIESKEST